MPAEMNKTITLMQLQEFESMYKITSVILSVEEEENSDTLREYYGIEKSV